jgi:hypothetical protein
MGSTQTSPHVIPETAKRLSGIQIPRRLWIPDLAALARDDSERPLDNYRYRIIFTQSFATRGMSADMLACGAGSAPAAAACNRRTGTLKGTVRGQERPAAPMGWTGTGPDGEIPSAPGLQSAPKADSLGAPEGESHPASESPRPRKHRPLSEKPPNWSAAKRQPLEREAHGRPIAPSSAPVPLHCSTPGAGNCALELKAFVSPFVTPNGAKRRSGIQPLLWIPGSR